MNTIGGGTDLLAYYNDMYTKASSTSAQNLQDSLENKDYSTASSDELLEVCKDFEAYMVEQVMKQMQKMIPKSEEKSNSYLEYFGDTMVQEMASIACESNGGEELGIAQMLYEQMKRNYGME